MTRLWDTAIRSTSACSHTRHGEDCQLDDRLVRYEHHGFHCACRNARRAGPLVGGRLECHQRCIAHDSAKSTRTEDGGSRSSKRIAKRRSRIC